MHMNGGREGDDNEDDVGEVNDVIEMRKRLTKSWKWIDKSRLRRFRKLWIKTLPKVAMMALISRVLPVLMFIHTFHCDYIPKWSCDFENGLCHWLQAIDDQKDFKLVSGHEARWNDHTTKSEDGKFLYLYFGSRYSREEVNAKLMSPTLMPNNGSCKMILHYKTYKRFSYEKAQVYVNMISKGSSGRIHHKPLFQSYISSVWARQDVILQSNVEFQVEIVGIINTHYSGRVGIDDIWFSAACHTNEKSPIRLIKLQSSPSHNYPAGVFYENLNGSWSAICSEDRARSACNLLGLKDVKIGNYDSLYGHVKSGQGICLPNNITVPTSKLCNNESSCRNATFWECKQDYISICPKLTHIACTSAVKNPVCISHNQICDFHHDCPGGEDESDCLEYNRCDFQKDMCDWVAAKHSLYEWKRYYDNVLRKFCVNVNSYHGHDVDGIAQLRLKYLIEGKRNGTCTIRFRYRTEGLLRMVLKEKARNKTVWSVTSALGQWRRAFVELPDSRLFQVFFEAIIADETNVDEHFGLADISFSKDCNFSNHTHGYPQNDSSVFFCQSGEAIEKNFVCDFKVDCFDGSDEFNCSHIADRCDFDKSFCDWQVGSKAPERLRRWKGRTPSSYTGPSKDHTNKFENGYYVYLEATGVKSGDYGYLISRTMQRPSTRKCTFRWFYHMWSRYDYGMGKLSIIYRDVKTQSERILWQVRSNQGNVWKYGSVSFDITSFQYKIIIKAERGASYMSDIAIDDVSFTPECLQADDFEAITITKYPSCPSVKYTVNGARASLYQFGSGRVLCDVTIRTDPRLRINLYAEFFNTDLSKKVTIDAGRNGSVIYGGNFSGSLQPFSLVSSTNVMNITVPPLGGNGSHSFTFNITATDQPGRPPIYYQPTGSMRIDLIRECRRSVSRFRFTSSGTVKPRKPYRSNYYYNNERCIYKFIALNGYRIKFTFNMFDTELHHDYVQILNNGIIGQSRFTGSYNLMQFISKRSHVEMLFVTDRSIQRRGFSLSVMTTDDKASAAKFTLPTTMHPWFTSTPYQQLTSASLPWSPSSPSVFLNERCTRQSTSQFATGDYQYGAIYFDSRKQSSYLPHCSWRGSGSSYEKYLLEFIYIDTGSWYNVLTVNYETGLSHAFRGHVNVKDLDIFEADNQFIITVSMAIRRTFKFKMGYSRNLGCYAIGLLSHYTYKYKAYSECYCEGFKYGFLASNGSCYCGNRPPAYYGFFMQNTSYCSSCFGSCGFGKLFIHTTRYNAWLGNQDTQKDKRKTTSTVIVSTVTMSLLVSMIIGYVAYRYYRKKCRTSTRRSVTPRRQGRNQGNVDPCAYFVNAHPVEGMLPSYEDATKDRVFFFNTLQDQQSLQRGIGEAPPSFDDALNDLANDRPPQYTEIAAISKETRADGTEVLSGHVEDYFDFMVALPDVESTDRPLSREGRPASRSESRNSSSLASLRNDSSELLGRPLIVAPLRNSESEGYRERRTNEVRHGRTSEERETPLEDRRRDQELRRLNHGGVSVRRNRNRATDLPPIQRVRAYDNRGVDST